MGLATASDALQADGSLYTRVWHFVQRQLHLRPRAASCPDEVEARGGGGGLGGDSLRTRRRRPRCLSEHRADGPRSCEAPADPQWGRVAVLKQLEAVHPVLPNERARRQRCYYVGDDQPRAYTQRARVQGTCGNCGARFFRALASDRGGFCGRDCQSSFEYRRLVQAAADAHELRVGSVLSPAEMMREAREEARGVDIQRRPPAF